MFWVELAIVLLCIFFGARIGGVALGTIAGLGLAVLVFGFRQSAGSMPVDVLLIIIAVVAAASAMQAAGGLDYMVQVADKILRIKPGAITFVAPAVSWLFTLFAGTGHVAYALLPVIAETSRKAGIRPERPMSISVIASQQSITASPISAATAGMIALFAANDSGRGLADILIICIPSTFLGSMIGALAVSKMGKPLDEDPGYKDRLAKGLVSEPKQVGSMDSTKVKAAILSVVIFLGAALGVVGLGLFEKTRPVTGWQTTVSVASVKLVEDRPHAFLVDLTTKEIKWAQVSAALSKEQGWVDVTGLNEKTGVLEFNTKEDGEQVLTGSTEGLSTRLAANELEIKSPKPTRVGMASTIEIIMIAAAGLIMLLCRTNPLDLVTGSVAKAGVVAVVSIMGIAWLGSTFFDSNKALIISTLAETVNKYPWTFSIALFVLSILLYSQAATVASLMLVGLQLGIEPKYLIAMFPAVNGYFFLPTYGTLIAAIQFDQTGTTGIGKYILNHSFMIPGLVATVSAIGIGFGIASMLP